MDFKDCIEQGLVKKKHGAERRAKNSLSLAERFLGSATKNLDIHEHEVCVMTAYNSLFHSCRALLFSKGYVERSHFCLLRAIESLYAHERGIIDFVHAIDKIRTSRHEIQYTGEPADREEAEFVIDTAKEFLEHVRGTLKQQYPSQGLETRKHGDNPPLNR